MRLLALAALGAALALTFTSLAPATQKKRMKVRATCSTEHTPLPPAGSGEDFARENFILRRRSKAVKRARVTGKLTDLTLADGDNVTSRTDSDTTDAGGEAELEFEFNNFGDYEISWKVRKRGYRTRTGTVKFHVKDRVSGACSTFR